MPPAVPRTRPATAFAGCEGGGGAGSTGILGGYGAESDEEIVDVGGDGDLETSPEPKSKNSSALHAVTADSKRYIRGHTNPHGRSRTNAGLMPSW